MERCLRLPEVQLLDLPYEAFSRSRTVSSSQRPKVFVPASKSQPAGSRNQLGMPKLRGQKGFSLIGTGGMFCERTCVVKEGS